MCSITDQRLALIGMAIDELAEAARVAAAGAGAVDSRPGTSDTMAERVARIWAMVADLDPALAHRLSRYTDQPAADQPTTGNTSTGQDTPDPGHA